MFQIFAYILLIILKASETSEMERMRIAIILVSLMRLGNKNTEKLEAVLKRNLRRPLLSHFRLLVSDKHIQKADYQH